ncbi:hypothetical protein GCM10007916_36680 [Psychromonas marina]|uniref:Type II secretion system protein H n=1 Tax=Psychromonas marina TaxID=88364 RepID=A0ABQ6E6E8_9GAMM|nr:GspH/FimT family protein [Psychromonas marina]GLS92596.1 hypothetical protein GCM10007916_36680 [Psychromonas marina]
MKKSGFTMIEMLITLSILAILLAIAAPNFKNLMSSSNMVSNANGMIGAFNYARAEAIKRGSNVNIGQMGGDWTSGIVVWVDGDGDGNRAAGEEVRLWPGFDSSSTVNSANANASFSFSATGEVNNDDQLTICDDRTGEEGMRISILFSGAIIAEKVNCV